MYYVAAPSYERADIAMHYIFNVGNGYWIQLECCQYSSPKLPSVYIYTVRASTRYKLTTNCYLMIKEYPKG